MNFLYGTARNRAVKGNEYCAVHAGEEEHDASAAGVFAKIH
jgi:hypothetical protein